MNQKLFLFTTIDEINLNTKTISCGYHFHKDCINKWFEINSYSVSCPVFRKMEAFRNIIDRICVQEMENRPLQRQLLKNHRKKFGNDLFKYIES